MHVLYPPSPDRTQPLNISRVEKARILVSDDQHDILTALTLLLKLNGFRTETVDSPSQAIELVKAGRFDLILMDLNYTRDTTSGKEGLDLLRGLREAGHAAPIVVMTAWGNVPLAVEAMRLGASDFVQKPWDNDRLLDTLRKQLEQAALEQQRRERARTELDIARHVQQKLFPQKLKPLRTLDYAAACVPARDVGGDYYDFFDLGENRLGGLLADVSGKGVAAAMLMANLQATFRSQLDSGVREATELLCTINRLFYAATPPEQYVTLFYFEYNDSTRTVHYVNCGHPAPALLRRSGDIERLDATSTVIGLFPQCQMEAAEVTIERGDVLALFTDGATDLVDDAGEEFGEQRFLNLVATTRRQSAQAATRHVTEKLQAFNSGREQFDDQTIVLLRGR